MAEILDNEVITAEILNDISIDLGYSELKFLENEKFGNDKLNAITGDLVSRGILNILNKCECVLSDTLISINTGVVVFADGAKKRITEINTLDILEGGKNYIYVKNDYSTGKIYLENSLTEPTGDIVLLAEYEGGVLTDRRTLAKAKVLLPTETNSYKVTVTQTIKSAQEINLSFPIDGINKIFIIKPDSASSNNVYCIFDVGTCLFSGCSAGAYADIDKHILENSEYIYVRNSGSGSVALIYVTKEENFITFSLRNNYSYDLTVSFDLYFYGGI